MNDGPILIKRYPNRRYYARNTSKYVSLKEIEQMVQNGQTVEIRDSQTGDDMTQAVLTQIIMERYRDMHQRLMHVFEGIYPSEDAPVEMYATTTNVMAAIHS